MGPVLWRVVWGPSVWKDKTGPMISLPEDGFIVIRLKCLDDAGESVYDVRMPLSCVVEVKNEKNQ